MFSRICLISSLLIFLGACDTKLGDQPPEPPVQEFSGTQCFSDLDPVVEDFFQGDAQPAGITRSWDCLIDAAVKFKRYVRGKSATEYTSQEIATFLEKNFLDPQDPQKVTPALQLEFMKLKQLVIGGRVDVITRDEIDDITVFMQELKKITLNLNPYMKILALKWSLSGSSNMETDIRKFEKANEVLQVEARQLATLIEKNGLHYKIADFSVLLGEVEKFFNKNWSFTQAISKYMPVVKKVKKALAGGQEEVISAREWRRFSVLGSRGYIQYLRYYYFIQSVPDTGTGYKLSYLTRTLDDLLSVFQDLVADKPEGLVTSDEIFELMKTVELINPEFKVSKKLILEVMKVKQLFFGGRQESLSSGDFKNARVKLTKIRSLIERFMPYYSIYGGEWDPEDYSHSEAEKIFNESQAVLETSLAEAGTLFEGEYDLNDLAALTRELENLYGINIKASSADSIQHYMGLAIDLKNMVIGGKDSVVKKAEWSPLLKYAAKAYSTYLYHHYFLSGKELRQPQVLKSWGTLAEKGIDFAKELTAAKPQSRFTKRELAKIGQHLVRLDILPKQIQGRSLDLILDLLVNRVLVEPAKRLRGSKPDALTVESLDVLRSEFYVWHETEMWLNKVSRDAGSKGLHSKELYGKIQKALGEKGNERLVARNEGLKELSLVIATPVPMVFDPLSRLILTNGGTPTYFSNTFILLNLQRSITRVFMRSFVGESRRITQYQGATLKETESAFQKIRPLMMDMDLLDGASSGFAASRFREANMFTPHGNGDSYLSFAEMTDLAGMVWSGLKINTLFRRELVRSCVRGRWNSKTPLSVGCAMQVYFNNAKKLMSSAAIFVKYTEIAPRDRWNDYMYNMFKAAGYVPNANQSITLSDMSLVPHVIQYVEMIYLRFDPDKNGVLNTQEALQAYPAFKGVIYELAGEQVRNGTIKEEHLVDVFGYILKYGKPPETLTEKLHFVTMWRGRSSTWNIQADRNKLSTILGYIADQIAAQKKPSLEGLSGDGKSPRRP